MIIDSDSGSYMRVQIYRADTPPREQRQRRWDRWSRTYSLSSWMLHKRKD